MFAAAGFNCRGSELWAKPSEENPFDSDPKIVAASSHDLTWGSPWGKPVQIVLSEGDSNNLAR